MRCLGHDSDGCEIWILPERPGWRCVRAGNLCFVIQYVASEIAYQNHHVVNSLLEAEKFIRAQELLPRTRSKLSMDPHPGDFVTRA